MSDHNNPVWDVYDLLRLSCLNMKYYSRRLALFEQWNFGLEVFLALSTSSAVAGLFLASGVGKVVWGVVGAITSIILAIKPILNLPKRIKEYETTLTGYRALHNDIAEIKVMISQKQAYDGTIQAEFTRARKRHGLLVNKSPETKEDPVLKKTCEIEVLTEYPTDFFYVPPLPPRKTKEKE